MFSKKSKISHNHLYYRKKVLTFAKSMNGKSHYINKTVIITPPGKYLYIKYLHIFIIY